MRRSRWPVWLVCWGLTVGAAAAQERLEPAPPSRPRAAAGRYEGIWFTPRQVELFLHRVADDMAERYEFDDNQLYLTRELLQEHIPRFLDEHRAQLQPLLNEFIEAQLGDEPPSVDYVADWAQRALPLMNQFAQVVDDLSQGMREYLSDEQVVIMEGELAAFHTGWQMISGKVAHWSEGGYDPVKEWPRHPEYRRELKRQREREIQQAMEAARRQAVENARRNHPPASADATSDAWARYVEQFVRRYKFTAEQKQKAYRLLETIRSKRDNYLNSKLREMERIEKLIARARDEPDRQQAQAALEKLNAPVERWFRQLKAGLQRLPTRAQRRAAARAERQAAQRPPADKRARKPASGPAPAETSRARRP